MAESKRKEDTKELRDKKPKTKMRMTVNLAASLAVLLLASLTYFVALGTTNWSASGQVLKIGIWEFCVFTEEEDSWRCYPSNADFSMASQAFSILAAMCYACAFLLYVLYIIFKSLNKSKPITMGLCLLAFCIVSLQIMTMIVYGVKVKQYFYKIERNYFSLELDPLNMSWSFAFAIVSTILSTVTGICTLVEMRNIALDEIADDPVEV